MPQIGWSELLVIVILAVLIIGPKDLPVVVKKIASSVKKIKSYVSNIQEDIENSEEQVESVEEGSEKEDHIQALLKKAEKTNKKTEKKGVVYLSSVPPFMNPSSLRKLMESKFDDVERIYME